MTFMPTSRSDIDWGNPISYGLPMPQQSMPGGFNPGTIDFGGAGGMVSQGLGTMDIAKLGLSGLGTLGNLWGAFQSAGLAKKQFNFTKDITEKNLANQIATYNTALSDRARSRAAVEGQTDTERQSYIDANSLRR